jgi:hypothetical protein
MPIMQRAAALPVRRRLRGDDDAQARPRAMHQYGVFRRLLGCGAGEVGEMTRWGEIKCARCAEADDLVQAAVAAALTEAAEAVEDYCADAPDLAGHGHSVGIRDAILALIREGRE